MALKSGIKSPDSYYADGKKKGKVNRDKQIDGPKIPEKAPAEAGKKIEHADPGIAPSEKEDVELYHPLRKPSLNEIPNFVKKSSTTEIPGLLKGFRHSKR